MTRQKILITGASSGLGAGMARAFAAKGRDLALCARRTDRLDELKAELLERHPGITVAVAALDVNDHEQVPKVFAELSDELGGIDRVIVNAGIGKGCSAGLGQAVGQQGHHRDQPGRRAGADRDRAGDVQEVRRRAPGAGLLGARQQGRARRQGRLCRQQGGVSSLGESLRAEYPSGPIRVTVLEPGYIESEMTAKSASTMLMVDNETGVKAMVAAIEREKGRAVVPRWPWAPLAELMKVLPPRFTKLFA